MLVIQCTLPHSTMLLSENTFCILCAVYTASYLASDLKCSERAALKEIFVPLVVFDMSIHFFEFFS